MRFDARGLIWIVDVFSQILWEGFFLLFSGLFQVSLNMWRTTFQKEDAAKVNRLL